jgi:hypothetical protein
VSFNSLTMMGRFLRSLNVGRMTVYLFLGAMSGKRDG